MPADSYRLRWAPAAKRDLREVWRYYANAASPKVADQLLIKITDAVAKAAERPLLYRPRDSLLPGLRAVIVHPYTAFYRMRDDELEVVRILHERRDFSAVFRKDRE